MSDKTRVKERDFCREEFRRLLIVVISVVSSRACIEGERKKIVATFLKSLHMFDVKSCLIIGSHSAAAAFFSGGVGDKIYDAIMTVKNCHFIEVSCTLSGWLSSER